MKRTMTAAAALLLATACGSADDHGHDHGHGHDHAATEPAAEPAKEPAAPETLDAAAIKTTLGSWSVSLIPGAESLRMTATDAAGAAVVPSGPVQLSLTRAGGDAQQVTLEPDGEGWTAAVNSDGGAFMAELSAEVDGEAQTARAMWGDQSQPAPDAAPAEGVEGAGGDPVGGHDHGAHGHEDH
jgi:hypothetical protein